MRVYWLQGRECLAMTAQEFYDLINLDVFALVFGLSLFAFAAGHAAGSAIGVTRKITHMST